MKLEISEKLQLHLVRTDILLEGIDRRLELGQITRNEADYLLEFLKKENRNLARKSEALLMQNVILN